jgi:hypothetical protein
VLITRMYDFQPFEFFEADEGAHLALRVEQAR